MELTDSQNVIQIGTETYNVESNDLQLIHVHRGTICDFATKNVSTMCLRGKKNN